MAKKQDRSKCDCPSCKRAKAAGREDGPSLSLSSLRDASRATKAIASLVVSVAVILGLLFGVGPLPAVPATFGSGRGAESGEEDEQPKPTINLILGSRNVHFCQK